MKQKLWIELVSKFCDDVKGAGRYSFTIPFIVGLEKKKNNRIGFTIDDIFSDIKESKENLVLSKCDDLEEYIIGKHKREYPNLNYLKRMGSVFIHSDELEELKSIEEVVTFMKDRYNDKIIESKFSKNDGNWGDFTAYDEKLIQELINN